MDTKILIKGAGEHASGTAHRLFRAGYHVIMTEQEQPTMVRRPVSFGTAIYTDSVEIEGVTARSHTLAERGILQSFDWSYVPVFIDPACAIRNDWQPHVLIDARIMKRNPDTAIDDAPLTIAYGPGFTAGQDVHIVVETNRGHDLGRLISCGQAEPDTGVPGSVGGESVKRVLRSPAAGVLIGKRQIGELVQTGDTIALVGNEPVTALLAGVLRGLAQPGLTVTPGQKLGDVDPRGDRRACVTLSDKTRAISGAALEIIVSRFPRR